jgi:predicted dienelactone hydrolase
MRENAVSGLSDLNSPIPSRDRAENSIPVDTLRMDWMDAGRNRPVPVKFYLPKSASGPLPIILFSHGMGGSRENYGYLGRFWAAHGYVCVHTQHIGSDTAVWENAPAGQVNHTLRLAARDPSNAPNRVADIHFVIDQLIKASQAGGPLRGRLDTTRIGMSGHSFGAMTTMAIAGQVYATAAGATYSSPDPRVKAAIAMSTPVPRNRDFWPAAFAGMRIPCLHMTGTLDESPLGETSPGQRRVPFDHTRGAPAWLITFAGGDHMVFTGTARNKARADVDTRIYTLITQSSLAFWDAWLKDDPRARQRLGGFAQELGANGTFEVRE